MSRKVKIVSSYDKVLGYLVIYSEDTKWTHEFFLGNSSGLWVTPGATVTVRCWQGSLTTHLHAIRVLYPGTQSESHVEL